MCMNDNVMIVKKAGDDFEKYINNRIEKEGYKLYTFDDLCDYKNKILNKLFLAYHIFKKMNKDLKKNKYTKIIVFDEFWVALFVSIINLQKSRMILWLWNTTNYNKRFALLKKRVEVWTFDPNQAEKNGWKCNSQFYFKVDYPVASEVKDKRRLFFVGNDKKRYVELKKIELLCKKINVGIDFHMVSDETTPLGTEDVWITHNQIPYSEIIKMIVDSDIILEINKEGQKGLTFRALESVFFKKKLITNNKEIVCTRLYNPNNVFILSDQTTEEDLQLFVSSPYDKTNNSSLQEYYSFKTWVNRFDNV